MNLPDYERFVREITTQFKLCEKACSLYLLTGDKRYAEDCAKHNITAKQYKNPTSSEPCYSLRS